MKTLLIFVAIVACAYAYSPPRPQIQPVPKPFYPSPAPPYQNKPSVGEERGARTVKFENEADIGAGYRYSYETDNGISAQENGVPREIAGNPPVVANVVQGAFQWTSPEGKVISVSYTADENGYHPVGDAIPK